MVLLAGSLSHASIQYMDFIENLNASLDLSTIYFSRFSGCWASFVFGCYPVLEAITFFLKSVLYVLFRDVAKKLSAG